MRWSAATKGSCAPCRTRGWASTPCDLHHPEGRTAPGADRLQLLRVSHQGEALSPSPAACRGTVPRQPAARAGQSTGACLTGVHPASGGRPQPAGDAPMARLADNLTALVEHCCTLKAPRHTPSDFPGLGLSQAALDQGAERARWRPAAMTSFSRACSITGRWPRDQHAYHPSNRNRLSPAAGRGGGLLSGLAGADRPLPALRSELVLGRRWRCSAPLKRAGVAIPL